MNEAIWFKDYQLDEIAPLCKVNLTEHLGIELTGLDHDHLVGTMPVDHRTTQPAGLLHGGASVALAETLGSIAANLCVDPERVLQAISCTRVALLQHRLACPHQPAAAPVALAHLLSKSQQSTCLRHGGWWRPLQWAGENRLLSVTQPTMPRRNRAALHEPLRLWPSGLPKLTVVA